MSCFKKVSLSFAALSVSACVFAGADLDSRVRELEKEMKQVRTETAAKTFGATTASARPEVQGTGFFVSFDVLYWQAKMGGTEFCYTDGSPAGQFPIQGRLYEANPEWDWGFRAGLGYNFDHGHWDVYANYTYFSTSQHTIKTGAINGVVVPLKGTNGITQGGANSYSYANKATSQTKFNFDRVDLELGRDFFVEEFLSFRPHIGLMTAWIDTKQTTRYTGGNQLLGNTVSVKDKSNLWGIGPRGGMNTKWYLAEGFSVFGNLSGALIYGNFGVKHKEQYSGNPSVDYLLLNANMHRFVPTTSIQLGLGYDQYVADDTQHISVSIGWDIQYWWRVNQALNTLYQSQTENTFNRYSQDLSLQGVTLHFRWDF